MESHEQSKHLNKEGTFEAPESTPLSDRSKHLPYDLKFQSQAGEFFGTLSKEGMDPSKAQQWSNDVRELASTRSLEELRKHPAEVAQGLASLGMLMGRTNPRIESNYSGMDDEFKQRAQQKYGESKTLFLSGCKKLYPGISAPQRIGFNNCQNEIIQSLVQTQGVPTGHIINELEYIGNPREMAKYNPEELLSRLDGVTNAITRTIDGYIWTDELRPEQSEGLEVLTRALYQVQLMRDALQAELYGDAKFPEEVEKIDALRKQMFRSGPDEQNLPAIESKELSSEDRELASLLNTLIEKDDVYVKNAAERGHGFAPEMKPFLEELRLLYPNPKQYLDAIKGLMGTVKKEYERILPTIAEARQSREYSALAQALRSVEANLPQPIKDTFSRATDKDEKRQKEFFVSQGFGGSFVGKTTPSRILGTLYNKIKQNSSI